MYVCMYGAGHSWAGVSAMCVLCVCIYLHLLVCAYMCVYDRPFVGTGVCNVCILCVCVSLVRVCVFVCVCTWARSGMCV